LVNFSKHAAAGFAKEPRRDSDADESTV
jgi:hypothetical protein